jgi:hypothetical protein
LLVSLSGVVGALIMLGFSFYGDSAYTGYMAVTSLGVYVAFFALGARPIIRASHVTVHDVPNHYGCVYHWLTHQAWDPSRG